MLYLPKFKVGKSPFFGGFSYFFMYWILDGFFGLAPDNSISLTREDGRQQLYHKFRYLFLFTRIDDCSENNSRLNT